MKEQLRTLIDKHLFDLIQEKNTSPHGQIFVAARSALSGGKRLRPLLTLFALCAYQYPVEPALTPACALELIHTYSLIHDDLPCMDNDDFRRGKPSLHKVFREGQALLTGDFLLTYTFELLANNSEHSFEKRVQLLSELARAAGSEGMIGGQFVDLKQEFSLSEEALLFIQMKTSSLFAASLAFAGILANVSNEELHTLRQVGTAFGIAFQLADDLQDGKGSFLYLTPKRIEELIDFYMKKTIEKLDTLQLQKDQLVPFFHTMIDEKLAETPF